MIFNITTQNDAYEWLQDFIGIDGQTLIGDWIIKCYSDESKIIELHSDKIQAWDIMSTDFIVQHATSSCDGLIDIRKLGILYLPNVLKAKTQLRHVLEQNDIFIDVDNAVLRIGKNIYPMGQNGRDTVPWIAPYRTALEQLDRAIYKDYTSTMLHCEKPEYYGIGLYNHPEFMEYLVQIDPMAKNAVEWWDNHSKGYLITAKIPFSDTDHETFQYGSQEILERDKSSGYRKAKEKLFRDALNVSFERPPRDVYLFVKRESIIDSNQVIRVEEIMKT